MTETKQHTFDTVARHMLTQGKRSESFFLDAKGEKVWDSAYRGRMRRKCALGALIPDNRYYKELEGQDIRSKEVLEAIDDQYHKEVEFLHLLQVIHDMRPEDEWANWLFDFTQKQGLHYSQDLIPSA